jgi:aspartyl-tRNA(Asn)/glutamyl-tRNA(Gln) amidotransferase subunit A
MVQVRGGLAGEPLAFVDGPLRAHPEQISPDIRARLYAAYLVTAGDYARANRVRRLLMERFADVLRGVDLLAAPATAVAAFPIGALDVPVRDYRTGADTTAPWTSIMIRNTAPGNLTGLPSISVPGGFTPDGRPFGLMLTARPFAEELLLGAAAAYEAATNWQARTPPEP